MPYIFCFECEKLYSTQSTLNRHMRNVHNVEPKSIDFPETVGPYKCREGCEISFKCSNELRLHLRNHHNFSGFIGESKSFNSYEDFEVWLHLEKESRNVDFVKSRGSVRYQDGDGHNIEKTYFDCNRSGIEKIKKESDRKRNIKSQGSAKINQACSSQIIVKKNMETMHCDVIYYPDHYGHENQIEHVRLSDRCRKEVASKLMSGVPAASILDKVRQDFPSQISRDYMINRQDIYNIKTSFNISIQDGIRHKDDGTSVSLWVKEYSSTPGNPVLFYKSQNECSDGYNFQMQDFCLIWMYPNQRDMLEKFGSNIVCIDGTHGLNCYDFELTTLLVIEEFGEGFPVAFLFSNRKDSYVYEVFFTCILNAIGRKIVARVFMSDITNVYYNSWQISMGPTEFRLFCSWHIDRAWQENLSKVKDPEKRKWVYKTLKYLQRLLDSEIFEKEYNSFLSLLEIEESTMQMYTYLKAYYFENRQQWAYCYRKSCNINTNMHLESMHKVIKYIYLGGKKIKRLDKSIHALEKYVRDKSIDRIIKLAKGKLTEHINLIHGRHRVALTMEEYEIKYENEDVIYVIDKKHQEHYTVIKKKSNSCCKLCCKYCHICIHMYECSCIDFCIRAVICKHIHFVCLNCTKIENPGSKGSIEKKVEINQIVQNLQQSSSVNREKPDLCMAIESAALQIIKNTKEYNFSYDQQHFMLKNLKVLLAIEPDNKSTAESTAFGTGIFSSQSNSPPNKKIEKQSLFSTKRNMKKNCHLKKPDHLETRTIKESLSTSLYISTDRENDHDYFG